MPPKYCFIIFVLLWANHGICSTTVEFPLMPDGSNDGSRGAIKVVLPEPKITSRDVALRSKYSQLKSEKERRGFCLQCMDDHVIGVGASLRLVRFLFGSDFHPEEHAGKKVVSGTVYFFRPEKSRSKWMVQARLGWRLEMTFQGEAGHEGVYSYALTDFQK